MKDQSFQLSDDDQARDIRSELSGARVPHMRAAAFCESSATKHAIRTAAGDRRLARVDTQVLDGGIEQAIAHFSDQPTPALLVVEAASDRRGLLARLDRLAVVCDPATKVIVIGVENDIALYRDLLNRGIADYLVGPPEPLAYVAAVQRLFMRGVPATSGRITAFMGAKGGVGASTLAQDVAWTLAESRGSPTLLADLDLRFGSASVNLDLRRTAGLEKYLDAPEKLDPGLLDRLLSKRGQLLNVLTAPADPLADYEVGSGTMERLIDIVRGSFSHVVLDLPREWSGWTREALQAADEVVIVAAPDLANLQNVKLLTERLKVLRPNDALPRLVLNGCGVPRRREIRPLEFAKHLGLNAPHCVDFDPLLFGEAAAEGRTLREQGPRSAAQKEIDRLVESLTGAPRPRRRGVFARLFPRRPAPRTRPDGSTTAEREA